MSTGRPPQAANECEKSGDTKRMTVVRHLHSHSGVPVTSTAFYFSQWTRSRALDGMSDQIAEIQKELDDLVASTSAGLPSTICTTTSSSKSSRYTPGTLIDLSGTGTGAHIDIGVTIPWLLCSVRVPLEFTLRTLKAQLLEKIQRHLSPADYAFRVCSSAQNAPCSWLDLLNEQQTVESALASCAPLALPLLHLHAPESLVDEGRRNEAISRSIGWSLAEVEATELDGDEELRTFRVNLYKEAVGTARELTNEQAWLPPAALLRLQDVWTDRIARKVSASDLHFEVWWWSERDELLGTDTATDDHCWAGIVERSICVPIAISREATPATLIKAAIAHANKIGKESDLGESSPDTFVLQLVGLHSFLTRSDTPMLAYETVRSAVEQHSSPQFVIRRRATLLHHQVEQRVIIPTYVRAAEKEGENAQSEIGWATRAPNAAELEAQDAQEATMKLSDLPLPDGWISQWALDDMLCVRPVSCSHLSNIKPGAQLYVSFSVWANDRRVASAASTCVPMTNPRWKVDMLSLELYVKDLPPCALLYLILWEKASEQETVSGKSSSSSAGPTEQPLGWATIRLVDWRGALAQGAQLVALAPPLGQEDKRRNGSMPPPPPMPRVYHERAKHECIRLRFELSSWGAAVRVPDERHFRVCVRQGRKWGWHPSAPTNLQLAPDALDRLNMMDAQLREGTLAIGDDEVDWIWEQRAAILNSAPHLLPLLASQSTVWARRERFGELYFLLRRWPPLSPATALRLLLPGCQDRAVRRHGVWSLDAALSSSLFSVFMLPLVQALKTEPYADSALARLLLKRSISDRRVGHRLFWLLRAELAELRSGPPDPNSTMLAVRIALLMEAYLRGSDHLLDVVTRQVDMVECLTQIATEVKSSSHSTASSSSANSSTSNETATRRLQRQLREHVGRLQMVESPLHATFKLGHLCIEECRVMGSAKQPLWLQWTNPAPFARRLQPRHGIIFKIGDDLRQDVLVLCVLELMDVIWKEDGMDACLSVYAVLPTSAKCGMIGVVPSCATLFQVVNGANSWVEAAKNSVSNSNFLNDYLRARAAGGHTRLYLESVDRFKQSLAGYSVATYVLGIKDRHNDNIMLRQDGRLFHIDFGHILGHGKTKLGIKREPVPFVLNAPLLAVVTLGEPVSADAHQVLKLRERCGELYVALWRWRHLFEALFALVLASLRLPELNNTAAGLAFVRRTLGCQYPQAQQAIQHFDVEFEAAFKGKFVTSTNWLFHTIRHM